MDITFRVRFGCGNKIGEIQELSVSKEYLTISSFSLLTAESLFYNRFLNSAGEDDCVSVVFLG